MLLKLGSSGESVINLQRALNKLGWNLKDDGNFSSITRIAVMSYQAQNGLKVDGIVGKNTWEHIQKKIKSKNIKHTEIIYTKQKDILFSLEQLQLIIKYEVGGGESYYNKFLITPTLPPAASGCTIMIGVDLRFTPRSDFYKMMEKAIDENILSSSDVYKLSRLIGIKPTDSQMKTVSHIKIPYEYALYCFMKFTVSKFWELTKNAFPGVEKLKWQAQVALLSLVFNRGASMNGYSRRHMRAIRDIVPSMNYNSIAQQIRDMKILWPNIKGLQKRRDAEADLVLS